MAAPAEGSTTEQLLAAVIALLVDERQSRIGDGELKTEILLHRAGLPYQLIASVMGKQPDAVRKAISRAGA